MSRRFSGDEGMPNHILLIDDAPGPDGYGVRCVPHGPLGGSPTLLDAYIKACEHDAEYCDDWL